MFIIKNWNVFVNSFVFAKLTETVSTELYPIEWFLKNLVKQKFNQI
jgi:hypothetical protein